MSTIKIDIRGVDPIRMRFGDGPRIMDEELRGAMTDSLAFIQAFLAKYPPPPPTSSYIRTGTLGKSWTTEIHGAAANLRGVVGNIRPYMPYVQDEEQQARVHRGRWPTIQQVERTPAQKVRAYFDEAIRRIISRLGGE